MDPLFGPAAKVTAAHLARDAYLYIRQSSLKQVLNNTESTVRQYGLKERAIALGWPADRIHVIDTDQGQSGASAADREGFQRLVTEVGMGHAGIVLGLEVSRLARNNTDWHRLLEICAMAGTLILDEDGLYDPCDFNDRLLLGLKGTMSEAELHLLKARLRGGQLSKARRGELISPLPIGLVYDPSGKVVLDPDTAIQQAIRAVFELFDATGSATAVVKSFNAEGLRLPRRLAHGPDKGKVVWAPAQHSRILQILHNPRYAGAFFYGRYQHRPTPGTGKSGPRLQPREQWVAFFPDHHPGYITLEKYDANQAKLAANATAHGKDRRHGPPREGPALLQGIVLCGICGRRMTVRYHQRKDRLEPEYVCQAKGIQYGSPICQRVHGAVVDDAVGDLLVTALTPHAIQAALAVADELAARAEEADRLRAAAVERAQYQADLARRRYLAVDPDNRLVATSLEADWNQALRDVAEATDTYEKAKNTATGVLDDAQRARITALARDFPALWANPDTPDRERKRLVRLLVTDVTLIRAEQITAHVRLTGGQEHTLVRPIPLASWQIRQTPPEVVAAIDQLLDDHTDGQIAAILTERGHVSGLGQALSPGIVKHIRRAYRLRSHPQRLADQGILSLREIARQLDIGLSTVKHWRDRGLLTGRLANDKGEYLYHPPPPDLARPRIGRPPRPRPAPDETPIESAQGGAV
ncbi:recombinase family protein [Streptomyces halobius]|uniref:Recombinase family protein n=1 Tax=Streptomyces halobius TaxID=2879846 RepID=A0ABY4M1J2_9ACTN|nr:recombinase family protein [Streptomyces halobius]UQA91342.1 recombinase family protein [Streptomyces halobius]